MKKILLACLAALSCLPVFGKQAPNEKPLITPKKIDGIGFFKLGMTTSSLNSRYPNIPSVIDSYTHYFKNNSPIIKLTPGTADGLIWGNHCKAVQKYRRKGYVVAGLNLDLELLFYNDELVDIKANKSLHKEFEAKYFAPEQTYESKDDTCVYASTGNKRSISTGRYTYKWPQADGISVSSVYGDFLSYKCEPMVISQTYIKKEAEVQDALECGARAKKELEKKSMSSKKEALEDL